MKCFKWNRRRHCVIIYIIINIRAFAPEVDRLIRENFMAFLVRCLMMLVVLIIYDKKKNLTPFPLGIRVCVRVYSLLHFICVAALTRTNTYFQRSSVAD